MNGYWKNLYEASGEPTIGSALVRWARMAADAHAMHAARLALDSASAAGTDAGHAAATSADGCEPAVDLYLLEEVDR